MTAKDIGEGIAVEWRQVSYETVAKAQDIVEQAQKRNTERNALDEEARAAGAAEYARSSLKAEQDLVVLLCKAVTYDSDSGERVRVDLVINPADVVKLPMTTARLLLGSASSPLALSPKPSP